VARVFHAVGGVSVMKVYAYLLRRLGRDRTILLLVVLGAIASAVILFIGSLLLFLYILSSFSALSDKTMCGFYSIERVTGIELPATASDVSAKCGGFANWFAEVQFDMKPSDLNVFVNSTNIKSPLSKTMRPLALGCCSRLTGFTSHLYGVHMKNGGEWFEEIFIDTSNPAQWRVYFTLLVD
jgi:hypothetical protein